MLLKDSNGGMKERLAKKKTAWQCMRTCAGPDLRKVFGAGEKCCVSQILQIKYPGLGAT